MSKTALLIIDVQNDYFPGGRMELAGSDAAVASLGNLLGEFRGKAAPVVHVRHVATKPGATFFLPETDGALIHARVRPEANETVVVKHFPNSFRGTDLHEKLQAAGITRLVITGMMTHMCVDTTVRAAFDLGYECVVVGDCCATRALTLNGVTVAAEHVQLAYLAALNGTFAKAVNSPEARALAE